LRADNYTTEKDRLDFARVLIATESLDVVKRKEKLVVDDSVVKVQVTEEWGYALRDDTFIQVEDSVPEASLRDQDRDRCDMEASQQVDKMVEDLADRLVKEEGYTPHQKGAVHHDNKGLENPEFSGPVLSPDVKSGRVSSDSCRDSVDLVAETVAPRQESDGKVLVRWNATKLVGDTKGSGCHRATSCLPGDRSPARSGPWSRGWLQKHTHGEAGLIFSSKKVESRKDCPEARRLKEEHKGSKKRKVGGPLCHALYIMKRIARLPIKDRREVLRILHKNGRRDQGRGVVHSHREKDSNASAEAATSSASVNNDWKHWVAMQGDERKAAEDIVEVGKSLGVIVTVDQANRFNVLSKAGKGKQPTPVGSTELLVVCW
jgi:hypothetical protein